MPDAPLDPVLDAALDELYGSDQNDFVAVRARVAAALAGTGNKAGAKAVRGARRPTTAMWALNQLARRRPQVVVELLERSADLVAAQTRALPGTPDTMRTTIHAHRKALDAATDAAVAILGSRSNAAFRGEIVSTLRAASTDAEIGRQLRTGRLIRELSAPGFPDASGLVLVPPSDRSPSGRRSQPPARQEQRRESRRQGERDAAVQRDRDREAQRRADLAERAAAIRLAAAADRDAARATARIQRLESELDAARRELQAALAQSQEATRAAERLTPTHN